MKYIMTLIVVVFVFLLIKINLVLGEPATWVADGLYTSSVSVSTATANLIVDGNAMCRELWIRNYSIYEIKIGSSATSAVNTGYPISSSTEKIIKSQSDIYAVSDATASGVTTIQIMELR